MVQWLQQGAQLLASVEEPFCLVLIKNLTPLTLNRREQILERKRREYQDLVPAHYDIEAAERSEDDACALRQARSRLQY